MKTKIITLALAAGLVGFAANAKADTHTRINVNFGISSAPAYSVPAPVYVPAPVVVAPANYGSNYHYAPTRGHWENVTTKVWIPERWVASRDRWGRPVRVLERGYYTYRTDRVWVDHGHRGYGYRG